MASAIAKRLRRVFRATPAQGARRLRWRHYTLTRVLSMLASRHWHHSKLIFLAGISAKARVVQVQ
eukprot:6152270-Pyramimonas_sp.AAC.1